MEKYIKNYNKWLANVKDGSLLKELELIKDDKTEIINRFSKYLSFGTAGMRGTMGVGTNNINIYTISKITKAVSNYLNKNYSQPSVVVAYDNREMSYEFAKLCAEILSYNNIKVYFFDKLAPTPVLSFAVRNYNASAGINITSSHNPKEYNGYKVFNEKGIQVSTNQADYIFNEMQEIDEFNINSHDFKEGCLSGKIIPLGLDVTDRFIDISLTHLSKFDNDNNKEKLKFIYTPLGGTGGYGVTKILNNMGYTNFEMPTCQQSPDPNFTTCPNPNPENVEAFNQAIKLAKINDAQLIIATDPDCDRVGVVVKHNNNYVLLSGNELGIIYFDFLIETAKNNNMLTEKSFMVTSVVSSFLTKKMAKDNSINFYGVLTGFKNLGDKIEELISKGSEKDFIFAFEESGGYLLTPHLRDKDGITPSALICMIANFCASNNKTLIDYLNDIFEKYGYIKHDNLSFVLAGVSGLKKINNVLDYLRKNKIDSFDNCKVIEQVDYLSGVSDLEPSNFIEYNLNEGGKVIVRPSGTEPKLKLYFTVVSSSEEESDKKLKSLKAYTSNLIQSIIDKF